jgi:hypothetical protein
LQSDGLFMSWLEPSHAKEADGKISISGRGQVLLAPAINERTAWQIAASPCRAITAR